MTNIRLDPDLWTRVKAAARERGTTLERWVSEALLASLERQTARPANPTGASAPPPDELRALHWRVEALEAAVDYLAGRVGADFPLGGHRLGVPAGEAVDQSAPGRRPAGAPPDAGQPPAGHD